MPSWTLELEFEGTVIPLSVGSPGISDPVDDCREVNFTIPGKGRRRAVFFLLPQDRSWSQPVRWDDKTMLFIPTLEDDSILAALRYILTNGLESDALEDEDDIAADPSY